MPESDFLSRLGLYIQQGFLDAASCARLSSEMRMAPGESATVNLPAGPTVDEAVRRTKYAHVSEATRSSITKRLQKTRPKLEQHFSLELSDLTGPQFLVYREGDHFRIHADNKVITRRRVSFVVFVNDQSEEHRPDSYEGGSLSMYGLLDQDPRGAAIGLPVPAGVGTLIAFRSELLHDVAPVTRGERCSIVGWFLGP
jgi:SM-20-related protein